MIKDEMKRLDRQFRNEIIYKLMSVRTMLCVIMLTSSFLIGFAETEKKQMLVLTRTDGKVEIFDMEDKPVISFDGGDLLLTLEDHQIVYPMSDVRHYYFDNRNSGIINDGLEIVSNVSFHDGLLSIHNGPTDSDVNIYNINGIRVISEKLSPFEHFEFNFENYAAGVYIVKSGNRSFRIIK